MPALRVEGLSKAYPGVQALDSVSLEVARGGCHALLGENGAGKSTLGKIVAGLIAPDQGTIEIEGRPVRFHGSDEAIRAGVAMVHQEMLFCENLSVGENLCLAALPAVGPWVDREAVRKTSLAWLARVGAEIDPGQPLGDLPVSKQQMVQIAGAIGRGARLLVFDEPTSSLSRTESLHLLDLIRQLCASGVTCVYVSHRLEEVFAVCDSVTVLRDGRVVHSGPLAALDRDAVVRLMVGRDLAAERSETATPGAVRLRIKGLTVPRSVHGVSIEVRAGEIVGLAGLVGAGRTELLEAAFGLNPEATGEVELDGEPVSLADGAASVSSHSIGLVPEDRKRHGLALGLSVQDNVVLPSLDRVAVWGWIRSSRAFSLAKGYFDRMQVKAPSLASLAGSLSGGNQQKVVMAKWLAAECDVLLIDEPTRGVDVGAKVEIHNLVRELVAEGKAILFASSDLPEVLALAHRILVLREGQIVGELGGERSEEAVMRLMAQGMAIAAAVP